MTPRLVLAVFSDFTTAIGKEIGSYHDNTVTRCGARKRNTGKYEMRHQ